MADSVTPPSVRAAFDLEGLVALVVGGSSGIGQAIAVGLGEMGASVVVTGRRPGRLEGTVQLIEQAGGRATGIVGDVTVADDVRAMVDGTVEQYGRIDALLNVAGVTVVAPSLELSDEDWDRIIETNLRGSFRTSVAAARRMIEQGDGGAIVNIASIGALRGGAGVYTAYSASKGGVVSMTRSHATEWAGHGVRVNCIAAGAFRTEMSEAAYDDPRIHESYVRRIPLGRTGEAHEIAPLATLLVAPASRFITGQVIVIDGGQVVR